jgi:hypothetical protein
LGGNRPTAIHRPELQLNPLFELAGRAPDLAFGRDLYEAHGYRPSRRSNADAQPSREGFAPHRK